MGRGKNSSSIRAMKKIKTAFDAVVAAGDLPAPSPSSTSIINKAASPAQKKIMTKMNNIAKNNLKSQDMKHLVKALDLDISDSLVDYVTETTTALTRRDKLRRKYASKTVVKYAESVQTLRKCQTSIQQTRDDIIRCETDMVFMGLKQKLLETSAQYSSQQQESNDNDAQTTTAATTNRKHSGCLVKMDDDDDSIESAYDTSNEANMSSDTILVSNTSETGTHGETAMATAQNVSTATATEAVVHLPDVSRSAESKVLVAMVETKLLDIKKLPEPKDGEESDTEDETLSSICSPDTDAYVTAEEGGFLTDDDDFVSEEEDDGEEEDADDDHSFTFDGSKPFIDGFFSSMGEQMASFFQSGTLAPTIQVESRKDHKRIRKIMIQKLLSQPELQRQMNASPLMTELKTMYMQKANSSSVCTNTRGCRCDSHKDVHEAVLETMVACFLHHFVGVEGAPLIDSQGAFITYYASRNNGNQKALENA
ncbi:expressed unknown protein [Seminavis robusta]|uniref:Uncharacterized protein n=1 Tax=Seminavis robusta TaxID=568900 RepID=A0A9N8HZA7_9STRA|nr:expressed unknown protein [Seminavis robusta]|eukprot:Sro2842_g338270.1 n/a (481) ;mRNA; f:3983-5425